MKTEVITKKSNCSGCGACQNICPKDAVTMCHKLEGTYPHVNQEKCVKCGLCVNVCPIDKNTLWGLESIYPIVYACKLKDKKKLKNSTSGGVFIALAKKIISKGGAVFGAVSGEDFRVNICSAVTEEELVAMQGSKYVESNTRYSFREVEAKLNEGKICFYTALPCQIAGLLSYLEKRNVKCENLYTADLVCHGAPSEKLFLNYLENYQKTKNIKLSRVIHRYKNSNWNSMVPKVCAFVDLNAKKEIKAAFKDGYLNGFLQGKIYRKSCYECKYASMPRRADFTLADFTGLGVLKKKKNDYNEGVSQLLVNTKKGKLFFESVKNDLIFEERDLYEALFFNRNLWKPSRKSEDTNKIFRDFEHGITWDELRKKYFDKNIKNMIVMSGKELVPKIFGANLTLKVMYCLKKKKIAPDEVIKKMDIYFNK